MPGSYYAGRRIKWTQQQEMLFLGSCWAHCLDLKTMATSDSLIFIRLLFASFLIPYELFSL
jgi:hypothetical protein